MSEMPFVTLILVVIPLFWCFVVFLISRLSGWASLAAHYGVDGVQKQQASGLKWHRLRMLNLFRTRWFPGRYQNAASAAFDNDALYLKTMILFRVGHTMLRVPWSDIELVNHSSGFRGSVHLRFYGEPGISLMFYGKHKDKILEALHS